LRATEARRRHSSARCRKCSTLTCFLPADRASLLRSGPQELYLIFGSRPLELFARRRASSRSVLVIICAPLRYWIGVLQIRPPCGTVGAGKGRRIGTRRCGWRWILAWGCVECLTRPRPFLVSLPKDRRLQTTILVPRAQAAQRDFLCPLAEAESDLVAARLIDACRSEGFYLAAGA
jgi:hypothetical protein